MPTETQKIVSDTRFIHSGAGCSNINFERRRQIRAADGMIKVRSDRVYSVSQEDPSQIKGSKKPVSKPIEFAHLCKVVNQTLKSRHSLANSLSKIVLHAKSGS